jgi:hypothetical protein
MLKLFVAEPDPGSGAFLIRNGKIMIPDDAASI